MDPKYSQFFEILNVHDSICIVGHCYPDGDCYGSSQGLKALINHFYPQKKVYVLATDYSKAPLDFPHADEADEETISQSLIISVDLPDMCRASDTRVFNLPNKGVIKIDHHILKEHFGIVEIVEEEATSCCEIIARLFLSKYENLPQLALNLLYLGFATDTNRFMYSNKESAFWGAKLINLGAETQKIYDSLYAVRERSLRFTGYIYEHYQSTPFGVCYVKVPYEDAKKYGYDPHTAALFVNSIGKIEGSRLWLTICETEDHKAFCEFRSLGNIDVQGLARHFTGGGHLNASGCTLSSYSRADEVIQEAEKTLLKFYFGSYNEELEVMFKTISHASDIVMDFYKKGFDVETKEDQSPVTSADKASDSYIRKSLRSAFPNYGLLSEEEEDDLSRLDKKRLFIVDPLDGTKDFVAKDDMFAINIALVEDHKPVVSCVSIPAQGKIYFAVKDKGSFLYQKGQVLRKLHVSRKTHKLTLLNSVFHQNQKFLEIAHSKGVIGETMYVGSALKSCLIAEGKAECCYSIGPGTKEWDTCAPQLVLEEAGGIFVTNDMTPITYNRKDVRNLTGFVALNDISNAFISKEEMEEIRK